MDELSSFLFLIKKCSIKQNWVLPFQEIGTTLKITSSSSLTMLEVGGHGFFHARNKSVYLIWLLQIVEDIFKTCFFLKKRPWQTPDFFFWTRTEKHGAFKMFALDY